MTKPISIFLLLLLPLLAQAKICNEQPQRSVYMSFQTLSKRDTLPNLFDQMSKNMTVIDSNYTDQNLQANFRIIGMHPHPYYNDHYQKDEFVDRYTAKVTMGVITVASFFNFSVNYADKVKSGQMKVRGFMDPGHFTKKLKLVQGALQWSIGEAAALTFSQQFHIEYTTQNLTEPQHTIFLKMLNNQAGIRRIRQQITIQINTHFIPLLQYHLNHEDLINSNTVKYKYNNITLEFVNVAKQFELSNDQTKGLQIFNIFGLESSEENCTKLPRQFDQAQYGGLQQMYTFGIVRSMFKQALSKGLFDQVIDKAWNVPGFQFYMGDLGNSVPYANYAQSNAPFTATCKYNTSLSSQLFLRKYDEHMLYISVPQTCKINYNNTDILQINFDISLYLRIVGQMDGVRVVVQSTGVSSFKWNALDHMYQLASQNIAKYSIQEVLDGLKNKATFGTDFPAIRKYYPVVRVLDDRIVMFDPAQP